MASDADTDKFLLNNFSNATSTSGAGGDALPMDSWKVVVSSVLLLICISGIVGNCCVIVVIVRYAKTKTVTNLYIANLAVADLCFLVGLPFLVVTSILERWVFGDVVCRLFFVSTSINWFASVFILTVMSVDRYLAVCWPVASLRYRTLAIARVVCVCVWAASMLAMIPVMIYATAADRSGPGGGQTCTIRWPHGSRDLDLHGHVTYHSIYHGRLPISAPLTCVHNALAAWQSYLWFATLTFMIIGHVTIRFAIYDFIQVLYGSAQCAGRKVDLSRRRTRSCGTASC